MNKRNLIIGGIVLLIAVVAVGAVLLVNLRAVSTDQLLRDRIIEIQEQAEVDAAELQRTDQITTVLCGTGSPIGNDAVQPCAAVFVNGQFLLFDVGRGAIQSMGNSNIPLEEVDAIFVTHHHNDHIAELGEMIQLSWMNGRRHILPVYGPTGITQIVDAFTDVYELDRSYRTGHHGEEVMPPEWAGTESIEFAEPEGDDPVVVYENDGVTVEAFLATHPPIIPNVGYRISYSDQLIVISGDTILTSAVLANSQDADLLVADIMNHAAVEIMEDALREFGNEDGAIIFYDIREYHMDVSDVAELAQQANVERLALTHFVPLPQSERQLNSMYLDPIREVYDGEIYAGDSGLTIVIPLP
jgi:ribonuclease Z